MKRSVDIERLQSNIAWAIKHGLEARDLVPMLDQLLTHSEAGSSPGLFAALQLAELLVEREPWRAALLAKRVLGYHDDERAWAVLALAYTLLGHHRCARQAYLQALAIAPGCASYAHNLGHLIDVIFNEPSASLRLLAIAHRAAPDEKEIAASYAHALVRTGRREDARRVLAIALGTQVGIEETLEGWLRASPPPAVENTTAGRKNGRGLSTRVRVR